MLHRARVLTLVLAAALAACGGKSPPPQPVDVEGVCKIDPAAQASRRAYPGHDIACDPDAYAGYTQACRGGDVDQCYFLGLCMENLWYGQEASDPTRAETEAALFVAYGAGCDAHLAEACVHLGGLVDQLLRDQPEHPDAAALRGRRCDAYRTACHLGEELDGCGRCIASDCRQL